MDVKQYYRKIHEVEAGLSDRYPVVISLETTDGGKAGVLSEVSRPVAAKMIVEGCAVLASPAEKQQYLEEQALAKTAAEKAELARRVQVAIISDADLKAPTASKRGVDPAGNGR
jgi:uncharacterized protein (DUF58 family)